jgi:hypothetical protein
MPVAAQRSALAVAKDTAKAQLSAAIAVAGTSAVLTHIVGTFVGSGYVTIYSGTDGSATETLAVSAYTSGTLTVAAATKAHAQGDYVAITAAADAPVDFIPVTSMDMTDVVPYMADQGYRGSMTDTYEMIPGPRSGTLDLGGDVIIDTFGYLLAAMLGDVQTTGSTAPYTHVMSTLNSGMGQPTSLTLTDIEPVQARALPGCMVTDLSIKIDQAGLLTYTAKVTGFPSGKVAQPVQSFTGVVPQAAWQGILSIGGAYRTELDNATIDFKRDVTVQNTIDGNANPYVIWVGAIGVSGTMSFVYENENDIVTYLNNVRPAVVFSFTNGSGANLTSLALQMSKAVYTAAAKKRGKDMLTADVSFTALANTTDSGASGGFSPLKATLQSAKPASTYA